MKYIIDIPDTEKDRWVSGTPHGKRLYVPISFEEGKEYHLKTYLPIEDYTEPDRKAIEDEVWSFVDFMIHEMDVEGREECFGESAYSICIHELTYQEAKSKYEAWLKQKDEIHVGDEVTSEYGDGVVLDICENVIHILGKDGFWNEYEEGEYAKTGRHFDEVEELLKKMRGE